MRHRTYSQGMNDEVRDAVRKAMKEQGISQVKLAEELGVDRVNLTRALSGRSGKIPDLWQRIFERFGLEITIKKKGET